jgi:hypothetical protein
VNRNQETQFVIICGVLAFLILALLPAAMWLMGNQLAACAAEDLANCSTLIYMLGNTNLVWLIASVITMLVCVYHARQYALTPMAISS